MLSSFKKFLHRHRRKFIFSGLAIGGLALLSKYAERKLIEWHEEQTRKLLEQQKRKQHYERTLDTTRITLMQILPNVRRVIEQELSSEQIVQAIKDEPLRKKELWEELKVVSCSRSLCAVVCMALVAPVSHVMMMILAGHPTEQSDLDNGCPVTLEVRNSYMACFQDMIEHQLSYLISRIVNITRNSLKNLPLTRKLTLPQLESILQEITLSITIDRAEQSSSLRSSVLPWSQYLKEPEVVSNPDSNHQLRNMYLLTLDVLGTEDFNDVVNTLVQVGMNCVMDEIAVFYYKVSPFPKISSGECLSKPDGQSVDEVNKCKNNSQSEQCSPNDHTDTKAAGNSPKHTSNPHPDCVVAKLVPILSGVVHSILPEMRSLSVANSNTNYYNRLVVCDQLEAISYNVYATVLLNHAQTQV